MVSPALSQNSGKSALVMPPMVVCSRIFPAPLITLSKTVGFTPAASRTVMVGSSAGGAALAGPAGAASGALIGQELGATVNRPNLTRDGLVARAFKQATTNGPQYPAIPPASPVRGLLGQGPIVTPPPADTSFVRAVPADLAQRNVRGLLGPGATQLGAGADTSGGGTVPARGIVIRDPRTGRFRRVYTAEAAPATTRQ